MPASQPATTKAGKVRQRMTWTREMNRHVMWCYYQVTRLETQPLVRSEFLTKFHEKFPELTNVTAQRLVDQKRVIISNNRLTLLEREDIKKEVAEHLTFQGPQARTPETNVILQIENQSQDVCSDYESSSHPEPCPPESQEMIGIRLVLEGCLVKWMGTAPGKRSPIPRIYEDKRTKSKIQLVNSIMSQYIGENSTIEDSHTLIYCAAMTIGVLCGRRIPERKNGTSSGAKPAWQLRMEKKIDNLRRNIGRLTQYIKGNRSKKLIKSVQGLNIEKNTHVEYLDRLKQKLAVQVTRLRKYKQSVERKAQNRLFKNNQRKFYQSLSKQDALDIQPPSEEEVTSYWRSIWSVPVEHKEDTLWIKNERRRHVELAAQEDFLLTAEELASVIASTHNWKATGTDNLHNFWYKRFTSMHKILAQQINRIIKEPETCPSFLTEGRTFLKPKNSDTRDPANYRPITCLQTLYKIITAVIARKIEKHLSTGSVMTEQQKGCRRFAQGCKEQLVIDSVVMKQIEVEQRNAHTAYIDYKKAFDSIPHSWLLAVLDLYKVHSSIRGFLAHVMSKWRTTIHLYTSSQEISTEYIEINRGIFQGDSLSMLWFCMGLNPLSNALNDTKLGIAIKCRGRSEFLLNHLLFVDDVKVFGSTHNQLSSLLQTLQFISRDIHMEFGIEKCKSLHIERGKWTEPEEKVELNGEVLDAMQSTETYKYLGFQQNTRINHTRTKKELTEKFKDRVTAIVRSYLSSKSMFIAINTYAIPVISYSFGIIRWSPTDLASLNRLVRTLLTQHGKLNSNSAIERVTLSRKEGGRGLIDLEALHESQVFRLRQYFHGKEHALHRAVVKADNNFTPLNLADRTKTQRAYTIEAKREQWAKKELHARHPNIVSAPGINKSLSYAWLQRGELFPETEGMAIAIQDQVIITRNYQKYILKLEDVQDDSCRRCHLIRENIEHVTGGCRLLVATDYTERHNIAAKIVHQELVRKYGLCENADNIPYYNYVPEPVLENAQVKLYWDRAISTNHTINENRPDIVLIDKVLKHTSLIEISVPNDANIEKKYAEKVTKYESLLAEVKDLWKQKTVVIVPLVMSVTGITPDSFVRGLRKLQLPDHIQAKIQKAVILKTCSIVRKFLNI